MDVAGTFECVELTNSLHRWLAADADTEGVESCGLGFGRKHPKQLCP